MDDKRTKVAKLIVMARGSRSPHAFAKLIKVSSTAMYKYEKGTCLPKPNIMKRMTSEEVGPEGGVTYETLMEAAGYEVPEDSALITLALNEDGIIQKSKPFEMLKYEKDGIKCVYLALVERNILFRKICDDQTTRNNNSINSRVELIDQPIKEWSFDFLYMSKPSTTLFYIKIGKLATQEANDAVKQSIVVNNKDLFGQIKQDHSSLAYRGELSLLLYDSEKEELVEEIYLAHYDQGSKNKEIYLV